MKQKIYWLVLLWALFSLGSCQKNDAGSTDSGSGDNSAPSTITFSPESLSVPQEGGTYSLSVTAPVRPSVSGLPDWITLQDGTFSKYKITFTLKIQANAAYEERTATLVVSSSSLTKSFQLSQAAAVAPDDPEDDPEEGELDTQLTNPEASAAACHVYDFLLSQNGLATLSGVQAGGTANNNERVEQVYQMTGKHPALAGYDYIFLQYSPTPASWDWVVNYGDISAPLEQWNNNGLVSFMWHWNVPSTQADWEKGQAGDYSGYHFYSKDTPFDISRALTEGTWEHEFILQDIEKVADYLQLLQEAGIPVLWRPLHEAAGNYTLYSDNGAWFWWGRGGAEPCKQLWKLLRDKLEGEYGLDNLIWVWTLDAAEGAEADYASWYPGNDLVDIVGVDIYAEDTAAKSRQYKAAVALSGGHKLVTVSECGNIPNPELCFADGESWSWFLTWDLESYSLNTQNYWKQLMASSRVLSREEMPSLK